ncbi:MAG: hypothetical protein MK289_04030 [Trichodesmium sp. ALOHA_ZT_67]|nr:hypothetical protein [Trichodesmium erythraeum GBRTRLIN201]MCH2047681.1 hypothetical protein [Trichodesmium sp. ALOHA_ZT_67]MDE5093970.1 hypothetical protein [Trichodesmium sp. St11_bin5]MDT9338522.1 hypothetical protein [Trichodesmium erythraeum 21-75]
MINRGSGWLGGDHLLPLKEEFNIDLNNDGNICLEEFITVTAFNGGTV